MLLFNWHNLNGTDTFDFIFDSGSAFNKESILNTNKFVRMDVFQYGIYKRQELPYKCKTPGVQFSIKLQHTCLL